MKTFDNEKLTEERVRRQQRIWLLEREAGLEPTQSLYFTGLEDDPRPSQLDNWLWEQERERLSLKKKAHKARVRHVLASLMAFGWAIAGIGYFISDIGNLWSGKNEGPAVLIPITTILVTIFMVFWTFWVVMDWIDDR